MDPAVGSLECSGVDRSGGAVLDPQMWHVDSSYYKFIVGRQQDKGVGNGNEWASILMIHLLQPDRWWVTNRWGHDSSVGQSAAE